MNTETTTFYAEILSQLGGHRFIAMTGAKNLVYDNKEMSIAFKIMRNSAKVTHVKIILTVWDTYTMIFYNCNNYQLKVIREVENVYCDELQRTFTNVTGLNTHL